MSNDEALREEAYLQKMMNKGKDSSAVKKNVFGGGLEAARAQQGRNSAGAAQKPTTTTAPTVTLSGGGVSAYGNKPAPGPAPPKPATYGPPPVSKPAFVPPPLECEVVELELPPPPKYSSTPQPVQQEDNQFINKALGEEAARKEEERMEKSIGRFAPPKSVLSPNTQPPPPTTYQLNNNTFVNTSGSHPPPQHYQPSHQTHSQPSYHQPSHQPSHQTSYQPSHQPSHQPSPAPSYQSHQPSLSKSFSFDPSSPMQVGNITPSPDPTANFLPLTSVACNLNDIKISVLKNGKNLQIRRTLTDPSTGQRIETKSLTLPYQVTPHTVAATYYPMKNNGELSIKLGKTLAIGAGEIEVTQFSVPASPGSPNDRVSINVAQDPDHFTFFPAGPSRYDTHFTVVIVGSGLEFRSVYSFQEGNATKTVNGKQVISLALPPRIDQIDINGDTLVLYPNRGGTGVEQVVADFDVTVVLA